MADKQKKQRGGYNKGLYNTPIYKSWSGLKNRCLNKTGDDFRRYGGRGITVCAKWLLFKGFYEDMGATYGDGLSIERIDNNGNYCKENCRWATKKEQANNRRTNTLLTIDGVTKTFARWCETSEAKPSTIRQRYYAYGWSLKEALTK